jgi:hypothetical protein
VPEFLTTGGKGSMLEEEKWHVQTNDFPFLGLEKKWRGHVSSLLNDL